MFCPATVATGSLELASAAADPKANGSARHKDRFRFKSMVFIGIQDLADLLSSSETTKSQQSERAQYKTRASLPAFGAEGWPIFSLWAGTSVIRTRGCRC